MKKGLLLFSLGLLLTCDGVNACGEIDNVTADIGTIEKVNSTNYVISIPEGTEKIRLGADTEYDWVEGYGPREISTDKKQELKVDGNRCGYGIYTYFFTFKHTSLIAENTEDVNDDFATPIEPSPSPDEETGTPNESALRLSSLKIEGYTIDFEPNTLSYILDVNSDVGVLNITAIPEDENNRIVISENSKNLQIGENQVTITVINGEGVKSIYTLIVNKKKILSNNNFLGSLLINGYQLNFDSSQTVYNLTIKKEKMLSIVATPESSLATYEVLGNSNLDDGSKITIRVSAEDGSTKDYIINISKEFNIGDYLIYIVIGCLILLLILLLIINKRRKNKKKMGPQEIEGEKETAGIKSEVVPEAIASNTPEKIEEFTMSTPGQIEYITPTNIAPIESDQQTKMNKTEAVSENTEVFKL